MYKYTANVNCPIAEPSNEMDNVVFRPNVSPICVDTKPAIIWTTAKMIDEILMPNTVPDFSNMIDA